MNVLNMYYYAGIPVITCNMLFYSMSAISSSITSSQNVFKFISEHKDSDITIFKNEVEIMDLENKLKIVEALIFDVLKKYYTNDADFETIKKSIKNPLITYEDSGGEDYSVIEMTDKMTFFNKIDEPIKQSLLTTSEIIQSINANMSLIKDKIEKHEKSYLNKVMALSLQSDINKLKKEVSILDKRLDLLLKLLMIYN